MEITERPPTRFDLPGRDPVYIATQRWVLEAWEGEDPPGLAKIWARKPKFAVNGGRSCAELAIVHHLRDDGWRGVWNIAGAGSRRPSGGSEASAAPVTMTPAVPRSFSAPANTRAIAPWTSGRRRQTGCVA
jgi:hypothetical protein